MGRAQPIRPIVQRFVHSQRFLMLSEVGLPNSKTGLACTHLSVSREFFLQFSYISKTG